MPFRRRAGNRWPERSTERDQDQMPRRTRVNITPKHTPTGRAGGRHDAPSTSGETHGTPRQTQTGVTNVNRTGGKTKPVDKSTPKPPVDPRKIGPMDVEPYRDGYERPLTATTDKTETK